MCVAWQRLFQWVSNIRGVCVILSAFASRNVYSFDMSWLDILCHWVEWKSVMCIWCASEVKDLFSAGDFLKQAEDWTSQQGTQAPVERVVEFNSIYELDCWSGRIVILDMKYCCHSVWPVLWWRRAWFNDQQFHYQSTCWYCWNARAYSFAPLARLINCFHHEPMDEHGRKYAGRNASSIQFSPASATWSEETHPRVSIPGRKLWFAGSLARNASPLDKNMRATWDARVIWHAIKSTPLQCCCVDRQCVDIGKNIEKHLCLWHCVTR